MDLLDIATILISLTALGVSVAAFRNSKSVRRQDLRMLTRMALDDALARVRLLPGRIAELKLRNDTLLSINGMTNSGAAQIAQKEREDMGDEATRLTAQLEDVDTDLSRRSEAELETIKSDADRLRRDVERLHETIDGRLEELDRGEKRTNEARRQFREEMALKEPMGGMFGGKR